MTVYIYIYKALGICIGGFCYWTARSPFGWHDSSSGTLLANESANSNLLSLLKYTHTPKSLQCLRLTAIPNQNARHDPCPSTDLAKPLSPLETLALTSLDQTIMVLLCSIRFWSNPIGTPVSNGPFFVGTVDAHKQKREAGPFPSLYTAGWVLIKEKTRSKTRSKTRYGKSPASTHMDFGPQAANLPFLGSLVAKQWQFAESQHTAMAV